MFQTFLAAQGAGRDFADGAELTAGIAHWAASASAPRVASPQEAMEGRDRTVEPSPTDEATRGDRAGADIARRERRRVAAAGQRMAALRAGEDKGSPFDLSLTPEFASQSVLGSAPMKEKRWLMGWQTSSPLSRFFQRTRSSTLFAPSSPQISVRSSSSTLERARMRSTRYCDMVSSRRFPRTTIQSFFTLPARKTTAWPAELPAPVSATSLPAVAPSHRLHRAGPIMHLPSLRIRPGWNIQPAVRNARPPACSTTLLAFDLLTIAQRHGEPRLARLVGQKLDRFVGDGNFGAEFLRLVVGPRHQRQAGNAGGKTQVILDPGRGPGLAAEAPAIQHQGRKPFRGGIDAEAASPPGRHHPRRSRCRKSG